MSFADQSSMPSSRTSSLSARDLPIVPPRCARGDHGERQQALRTVRRKMKADRAARRFADKVNPLRAKRGEYVSNVAGQLVDGPGFALCGNE